MSERLPAPLARLVRAFKRRDIQIPLMAEPVIAFGQCGWVSEAFAEAALSEGLPATTLLLEDPKEPLAAPRGLERIGLCTSHVVALVGVGETDYYVDWTARQFDAKAPFPLVTTDRELITEKWQTATIERAALTQKEDV
jgi:hypothetical protein